MHKTYEFEDSHYFRSGKRYKVDHGDYFLEYYPSISESVKSNPEESGLKPTTPQRNLGAQGNPDVPLQSSSSSQTLPSGQKTPTSQQTQLPQRNAMEDDIKLPVFRGTGLENLDQHWFLCEAMWNVKQVIDNNVRWRS